MEHLFQVSRFTVHQSADTVHGFHHETIEKSVSWMQYLHGLDASICTHSISRFGQAIERKRCIKNVSPHPSYKYQQSWHLNPEVMPLRETRCESPVSALKTCEYQHAQYSNISTTPLRRRAREKPPDSKIFDKTIPIKHCNYRELIPNQTIVPQTSSKPQSKELPKQDQIKGLLHRGFQPPPQTYIQSAPSDRSYTLICSSWEEPTRVFSQKSNRRMHKTVKFKEKR